MDVSSNSKLLLILYSVISPFLSKNLGGSHDKVTLLLVISDASKFWGLPVGPEKKLMHETIILLTKLDLKP